MRAWVRRGAGNGEEDKKGKQRFQERDSCGKPGEANSRALAAEPTTQDHPFGGWGTEQTGRLSPEFFSGELRHWRESLLLLLGKRKE